MGAYEQKCPFDTLGCHGGHQLPYSHRTICLCLRRCCVCAYRDIRVIFTPMVCICAHMFTVARNKASTQCHKQPWWCLHVCSLRILKRCIRLFTWLRSLSAVLRARVANCRIVVGPCPRMDLLVTSHPSRCGLSSMVWLSATTYTPKRPRRRVRPLQLRNMHFSLRWLPSMAKH